MTDNFDFGFWLIWQNQLFGNCYHCCHGNSKCSLKSPHVRNTTKEPSYPFTVQQEKQNYRFFYRHILMNDRRLKHCNSSVCTAIKVS